MGSKGILNISTASAYFLHIAFNASFGRYVYCAAGEVLVLHVLECVRKRLSSDDCAIVQGAAFFYFFLFILGMEEVMMSALA